jgi:transcriptional regulator with XRE-family HTH domain
MSNTARIPEWTTGDRLRKAREDAGIGVAEMALQLGVSRNMVTNYEHDRNDVSVQKLVAWATVTNTDITWLIGLSTEDEADVRSRCFLEYAASQLSFDLDEAA